VHRDAPSWFIYLIEKKEESKMSIAKKMSRVLPLLVFLSIQLIFVKNTLGAAVKSNIFKATSIQGNHRNADCNVTYTHHGKDCEDCDLSAENPAPITFKLGEGDKDFVRNSLCGGWQESGWSIQGVFQNQKTDFSIFSGGTSSGGPKKSR